MIELTERRTENSKTFDLGNGKRALELSIGVIDLAYAAGIIDGEGCIQIIKGRKSKYGVHYHYTLVIRVAMADPEPILWLKQTFGGGLSYIKSYKTREKGMYRWSIGARKAKDFLNFISPYLKAKQGQADIALEFQSLKKPPGTFMRQTSQKPIALLEAESILAEKLQELHGGEQKKDLILHHKLEGY